MSDAEICYKHKLIFRQLVHGGYCRISWPVNAYALSSNKAGGGTRLMALGKKAGRKRIQVIVHMKRDVMTK